MRKIHTIPIFAVLVLVTSFSVPQVFAAPLSITLSPDPVMAGATITTTGTGFTPPTVYLFVDGTFKDSVPVFPDGSIDIGIAAPQISGPHQISIRSEPTSLESIITASFTVNGSPSIPEFPFSFSLVIIFVAVAAVYVAIRQKMTANFRPF